jgi:hypothetical protein
LRHPARGFNLRDCAGDVNGLMISLRRANDIGA